MNLKLGRQGRIGSRRRAFRNSPLARHSLNSRQAYGMTVISYYYPAISCFLGKISRFMDSENSEIAEFRLGHSWKLPSPPPSPGGVAPGQGRKGLRAVFAFRHARPPVCLRLIYIPTVKKSPSAFPLSEPMASQPTASLVAATPRQVVNQAFLTPDS